MAENSEFQVDARHPTTPPQRDGDTPLTDQDWEKCYQSRLDAARQASKGKLSNGAVMAAAQQVESMKEQAKRNWAIERLAKSDALEAEAAVWEAASSWTYMDLDGYFDRVGASYLRQFGVEVREGHMEYPEGGPLQLQLELDSHEEHAGCTWYMIKCSLSGGSLGSALLNWPAPRRLAQLREFHDQIKDRLGDGYKTKFADTPFAHHAAPKGTTSKLSAWLNKLATAMNRSELQAGECSLSLKFFHSDLALSRWSSSDEHANL